jgi:hypothetical protein
MAHNAVARAEAALGNVCEARAGHFGYGLEVPCLRKPCPWRLLRGTSWQARRTLGALSSSERDPYLSSRTEWDFGHGNVGRGDSKTARCWKRRFIRMPRNAVLLPTRRCRTDQKYIEGSNL